MRVVGIICEYNPFHNGHALHLRRARALSQADFVVCVMSGSFTQRGEPAAFDKWTRAAAALQNGADAVFELPTLFALSPADSFARAGVSLLRDLGVVTHLSFGVEPDALEQLERLAALRETPAVRARIREGLAAGQTLPRARAAAYAAETGDPSLAALLNRPNLTLALEYLRALESLGGAMSPVPVAREGAGYHDARAQGEALCSATGVRAAIACGDWASAAAAVPDAPALRQIPFCPADALDQALLYALRTHTPDALRAIRGMDEGLEHRLLAAAQTVSTRAALLGAIKSKRYTHARLSRLLADVLLNVPRTLAAAYPLPTYARLLGMRRDAAPLLRAIGDRAALPIVNRPGRSLAQQSPLFALDVRATDVRALALSEPARQDLTHPTLRL